MLSDGQDIPPYYQQRYGMPYSNIQNDATQYQVQPRTFDVIYQALINLIAQSSTTFAPLPPSPYPIPPGPPLPPRPPGPLCGQYPCRPLIPPPCGVYPCGPPARLPCGAYPCRPSYHPPPGPPINIPPPPRYPPRYPCRYPCVNRYPNYPPPVVPRPNYPTGFATTPAASILGIFATSSVQNTGVAIISQNGNPVILNSGA